MNLLAHHALLAAALARAKVVTAEHVQAALANRVLPITNIREKQPVELREKRQQ